MSENKITVKPLEWERDVEGWYSVLTALGPYEARVTDRGSVRIRKPSEAWQEFDGDIDAAFSHLFSDYEQRILSAIDTASLATKDERIADLERALKDALWAIGNMAAILTAKGIESTLSDPSPAIRAALEGGK